MCKDSQQKPEIKERDRGVLTKFHAYLTRILAALLGSGADLLVNDVLLVGCVALFVGPDRDGDLLQRGGHRAAEGDGAPACGEDSLKC